MKKFFISVLGAAFLVIFAIGCNRQNEAQVTPNALKEKEPTSVIDLMEKEEGVKYFKKDVWLKSKDGKSEILMRFASKDDNELDRYISNFEFSINPLFTKNENSKKTIDNLDMETKSTDSNNEPVFTEIIEKHLEKDAMGVQLNVKLKNEAYKSFKNGRIQSLSSEGVHISDAWPEEFKISLTGWQTYVEYVVDKRMHWYYTWTYWFGWFPLSGQNAQRSHWLDGDQAYGMSPWKVRVKVAYDPVWICGGCTGTTPGYNVEFYNYW